jgi:histidine ammonia-lyase
MALTIKENQKLSLSQILAVAGGAKVSLSPATKRRLSIQRQKLVAQLRQSKEPAYGFNRGFGHNVEKSVAEKDLELLQLNLVRSHASGVGPEIPTQIVRTAMLLRAHSLAQGFSGVRPEVIQCLCDFLNAQITPIVPQFGSVGASGDLAPLAHIALALIGEGAVRDRTGRKYKNSKSLKVKLLQLQMKEGLALLNGVQVSTAYGLHSIAACKNLLSQAVLNTALVTQVMLGADDSFSAEFQNVRPHSGALKIAELLRNLCKNSPIREFHRDYRVDGQVQDPYNIRCSPQILGACYELLEQAERTLMIEAQSVTDNPLVFTKKNRNKKTNFKIVSGGHFHGMPVAVQLYSMLEAIGIIARLGNLRCVRFVDESKNRGLGSGLKWPHLNADESAASSAMMIPEYVSASLCNHIWGQCMPTHLFALSTDAGQEDHVSMSAGLAVRLWDTLPRLAEILAIELAYCVQAAEIRASSTQFPGIAGPTPWPKQSRKLSPICEKVHREALKFFPPVKKDRVLSEELSNLAEKIISGKFISVAKFQGKV